MYSYDDSACSLSKSKLTLYGNKIKQHFQYPDNNIPFYKVIAPADPARWVATYEKETAKIRERFGALVVISMGGATLNPQTLLGLCAYKSNSFPIHFLSSTDPYSFSDLARQLDLINTAFLIISSSGETLETISLVGTILNEFQQHNIDYTNNFYFILGQGDSSLRRLANKIECTIYEHESQISGRYAGLSNITTFIGLIAGLDMMEYLRGANDVINEFWQAKEASAPAKAAIALMLSDKPIAVNLGYLQGFAPFLEWYSQIIGESLGKEGKGFTPLKSLGPNDQHSMLQLYLEGPRDKIFTLFYVKNFPEELSAIKISKNIIPPYLAGIPLQEINTISFHSTISALKEQNLPVRVIMLNDLSEKAVGALVAHCMIEVIVVGHLLEVNPFDQPGVELIKKHANATLKRE